MTFVGVARRLRLALEVVRIHRFDGEPGAFDVLGHVAGEMAASGEALVDRFHPRLPAGDLLVGRMAVFDEMERAARLEDVQVESTASNSPDGRSSRSPVRPPYSTVTDDFAMRGSAMRMHTCDGSMATTFVTSDG